MTPRLRHRGASPPPAPAAAEPRREPAAGGLRWLHAVDAAPRVIDAAAVGRSLDAADVCDASEWRAAQLALLLFGVDLHAGPGEVGARWDRGLPLRSFDLASRAGISETEVERALGHLLRAGVLLDDALARAASDTASDTAADDRQPSATLSGARQAGGFHDGAVLRVAPEYVSDGQAATLAWDVVTEQLAGSAAALLVARVLADLVDRPGRPTVVPYSALVRGTRYSEGMVKRGVGALVSADVIVQRASRGRAPAYAFSEWALGRTEAPSGVSPAPGALGVAPMSSGPGQLHKAAAPTRAGMAPTPATLHASVAGVSVEVPAATGGELVVETVVDGRAVTARLTIPAVAR